MTQWVDEAGRDGYLASGIPWDVVSAASGHPWLVREGHLLTRLEMYWNDSGWETALGEAWNGTRSRSYIGLTYDNKLGVAAVSEGTGTCQAAWLLYKMGKTCSTWSEATTWMTVSRRRSRWAETSSWERPTRPRNMQSP